MSQIQPATDEQIEAWETLKGIKEIQHLIARVRQEQAEVATLQRLLDDERLRASEYDCQRLGAGEEVEALQAEVERLRHLLNVVYYGGDPWVRGEILRVMGQPPAPAEVQSTELAKSTELTHGAEEEQL